MTATPSLLIRDTTIIDGTGAAAVPGAAVLVEGDAIAYAGPLEGLGDRDVAQTIDGAGLTVVPGLIDVHNHSVFDADMRCYVKNGVTSMRFGGVDQRDVERLRERVEAGELSGPRIFSSGPMLDGAPPAYPGWAIGVRTPADAEAAARRLVCEERIDALIAEHQISAELLRPIVEVAHEHGLPVIGQLVIPDAREASELGIDELVNTSRIFASREYPAERQLAFRSGSERLALHMRAWAAIDWDLTAPLMDAMVAHDVAYCPTHVVFQWLARTVQPELDGDADLGIFSNAERAEFDRFMDGHVSRTWTAEDREYARRALEHHLEWVRRFHELGGTVITGTDVQYGGIMLHAELRNLADAGLSPLDVIRSATGDAARVMAIETIGTIAPGKKGDLLLIDGDPALDIRALRNVKAVVKDGALLDTGRAAEGEEVAR